MLLCYNLPTDIPRAVRIGKGILHALDKDHFPIGCYITAKTMVGDTEQTFQTSTLTFYRTEPERMDLFDDQLLGYIMENSTFDENGTTLLNCQITDMKLCINHVTQLQKTCPKCSLRLTAAHYARHLKQHNDVCGICQQVIPGDLEEHKLSCMVT